MVTYTGKQITRIRIKLRKKAIITHFSKNCNRHGYAPVIRYSSEQSLQIVPNWSKRVIWMVAMATKQNFEHCRTRSQLKAQQSLLLNSTISTTSWNYIFLGQNGFGVVTWCVGWCVKNESPKFCFYKCKLVLPKIQPIECRSFFICCCASKWYQWLRIWLSRNIHFVGVNVGMSARNHHFQTNYWCITI